MTTAANQNWIGTISLVVGSLLAVAGYAKDYKSEHMVEPGDLISADMVNELFDTIQDTQRSITLRDLLGTWKGEACATGGGEGIPEWQTSENGACLILTNTTVSITQISNNYFQLETSAPSPFNSRHAAPSTCRIDVIEGTLFGAQVPFMIDRISRDRIRLSSHNIYVEVTKLITLDRQNTSPEKPHLVSVGVSGMEVTLNWTDLSEDETGFVILRRDRLSGVYSNILNVSSNVACCTNTVPQSGIYWYRVAATNGYGSSVGSNVKRVVVP